ncbi:MAG: hypothetical protein CFE45_28020, partial [Burkholderiales bacterium PBB5]
MGLLLVSIGSARAAGSLVLIDGVPAQTTRAAGLSEWALPDYPGARSRQTTVLPGLDLYGASGWFVSTDNGVGWNLSSRVDVQAGVRLWPQFGRTSADAPRGLLPVGDRLQAQVFANQAVLPALLVQSAFAQGAGRNHRGTQAELGLTTGLPWGPNLLGLSLAA